VKLVPVVEGFNVIEQDQFGLTATFWNLVLEAFGFESSKEAFHHGVVVRIGFATDGSGCATRAQQGLKVGAGILDAAIRMVKEPGLERLVIGGFFEGCCYQ
jgi:hypothetical protein